MISPDPLWYKDAVIYELHVRAFFDANGDGIGDFRGLTEKLDYLQDLGINTVWLLPFYPSPLKDDGYDTSDYHNVHPQYGALRDFKNFLREAHRRDLRVITELVLNHTSDQHRWFQRARRAGAGSRWRDFYVWSHTPEKYREARIIFKDFETSNRSWDPLAQAYYFHRFYSHQPDLNFDNREVQRALMQVVDHWLEMGVDGLRLDAVPYLYEREETNCENLPETHEFLKRLRAHVDANFPGRMLLAEANQWPEDAVPYFGEGDECHTAFHFPVMPRLFMAIQIEDRFPIIDILEQTPPIPGNCQWVLFLRNHDELTLEMVTDEERDYMYRVYARDTRARLNLGIRRRLAPLMGNDRRKMELLNGLLLSLPGTPVIYYGDEIGMGDNIYLGDRNGVRTPMQWSGDRNAGFSRCNPQQLYLPVIIDHEYHYETVNVETQQNNSNSMLWWMRRILQLRQRSKAFARGTLEFVYPNNPRVLAFVRRYENESILVVANLSRFAQFVELDLSDYQGNVPAELFSRNEFPPIGELPYLLTLGPYAFYWFALQPARSLGALEVQPAAARPAAPLPVLRVAQRWDELLHDAGRRQVDALLPRFLSTRRWFGGKARSVVSASIQDAVPLSHEAKSAGAVQMVLLRVEYREGEPETYVLLIGFATGTQAERLILEQSPFLIAQVDSPQPSAQGVLYDAASDEAVGRTLLDLMASRRRLTTSRQARLTGFVSRAYRRLRGDPSEPLPVSAVKTQQSNSSIVFDEKFILKVFRRLEEGVNPDLEIGQFLTDTVGFGGIPAVAGAIEYRGHEQAEPATVAILQAFVRNEGDAWQYTLDTLGRFFERVMSEFPRQEPPEELLPPIRWLDLSEAEVPELAQDLCGAYLESAQLLGRRTAEMHAALASRQDDSRFTPEPFNKLYQRSLYQSARSTVNNSMRLLRQLRKDLKDEPARLGEQVLHSHSEILRRFSVLIQRRFQAVRLRCHGDYHLGQVLFTGKDFVIIDFEGEPSRPITERRIKRSPLRDVAGMLRSFHYAGHAALAGQAPGMVVSEESRPVLESWANMWYVWTSAEFFRAYRDACQQLGFQPAPRHDLQELLDVFLLEKAVYELGYELNNRPGWARVPMRGILEQLAASDSSVK